MDASLSSRVCTFLRSQSASIHLSVFSETNECQSTKHAILAVLQKLESQKHVLSNFDSKREIHNLILVSVLDLVFKYPQSV